MDTPLKYIDDERDRRQSERERCDRRKEESKSPRYFPPPGRWFGEEHDEHDGGGSSDEPYGLFLEVCHEVLPSRVPNCCAHCIWIAPIEAVLIVLDHSRRTESVASPGELGHLTSIHSSERAALDVSRCARRHLGRRLSMQRGEVSPWTAQCEDERRTSVSPGKVALTSHHRSFDPSLRCYGRRIGRSAKYRTRSKSSGK